MKTKAGATAASATPAIVATPWALGQAWLALVFKPLLTILIIVFALGRGAGDALAVRRLVIVGLVLLLVGDVAPLWPKQAFMAFPRAHWTQIYSTKPLERLNAQIKRRTTAVGIFPNDASIVRRVGAMMLEQNDEWSLNRRHMQLEGLQTLSDTAPARLPVVAR